MLKCKWLFFAVAVILALLLMEPSPACHAKVINSIVARVNNGIITLRDLTIEYRIQDALGKGVVKPKRELLADMVDDYLVLLDIRKIPKRKEETELNQRVAADIADFRDTFTGDGYAAFLDELEITEDDMFLRFKKRGRIEEHLKQKIHIKKNGSNLKKSMVLRKDYAITVSRDTENYISKLRQAAYRLMINDFVAEGSVPEID